jgi:acetyltransferase
VLSAFRIPTIPSAEARDANEALVLAESAGFPVAMKIASPDISHKSDAGGVRLGIQSAHEVRGAFNQIVATVQRRLPDAHIDGVTVEHMHHPDHAREVIAGITTDEAFGPVITFGAGGTQVELTRDRAVALPPINRPLARDLIEQTRVFRLLGEFRGMPAANLAAIEEVLLRVSEIACELPEVRELDINPLIVNEDGVMAVDARIAVAHAPTSTRPYAHLAIHPYPRELVTHWQLADGTDVTIRPIRPEDAGIEATFVQKLSVQSRYLRFRHALRELTPDLLVRFTQIDYDREMALVATIDEGGGEDQIGVARYVTNPDGRSCEFAIVVADEWQGRGLGARLIQRLIAIARQRGLETIVGEVMADNEAMLELMRALGFSINRDSEEGEIMIVSRPLLEG